MISANEGEPLLLVHELRLLGIKFDQELTWWPLTSDLVTRSRAKVWSILRPREAGVNLEVLKVNYCVRVRSILEYAAPIWGGLLNGLQCHALEEVQRLACLIILGGQASSYEKNLLKLELPTLSSHRSQLTRDFAFGCYRNPLLHKHG